MYNHVTEIFRISRGGIVQWAQQWRITKRSNAIIFNTTIGTSNVSQVYMKKIITDNSFDMIPPALDNGELNSTMANHIVYSPTETILEGYFCPQMVPSSCETKWCSIIIVLICFGALSKCHVIPI